MEIITPEQNLDLTVVTKHTAQNVVDPDVIIAELTEEFVDERYKIDRPLTEMGEEFWRKINKHFEDYLRDGIPIPFKDIADFGMKEGHQYPAIVQWMRHYWRRDMCRRFYRGEWQNAKAGNVTGKYYGVHYLWEKE